MRGFNRDTTIRGDVMLTIGCRRFSVVAICLITWFSTPAAFAQTLYDFNLPPQALADSLRAIGHRTSVNILFDPRSVEKLTAPAVHGQFSASQAVNRVLAGTNLAAEQTEANTLLVEPKNKLGKAQTGPAINDPPNSRVALAQAQTPSTQTQNIENTSVPDSKSKETERSGLSEIVVTGTHIHNADPITPVTVITHDDLLDQGYSTLSQAIDQLPQNFKAGASAESNPINSAGANSANNFTFANSINLRGLGTNATLVLLNGRRLAPTAYGTAVDISQIPVSIIDHIEILTDGASSIYGSDAVAGVVNIVTTRDFSGVELGGRVNSITDGKAPNYGANALGGVSWGSGNLVFDFDHETDNPFLASSRSFTSQLADPTMILPSNKISSY
jgi:iron complex outermembrane receptor protein